MRSSFRLLIAAFIFIGFLGQAKAGIYIEPFFGYGPSGKFDDGTSKEDLSGSEFGLRLGYSVLGLAFGAEYALGSFTSEPTTGQDTDIDVTNLGAFIGYTFPILIHVYYTYHFDVEADATTGSVESTLTGKGSRVGLGYTGLPFVAINLELLAATFDEASSGGTTAPLSPKNKSNITMISISVPLP